MSSHFNEHKHTAARNGNGCSCDMGLIYTTRTNAQGMKYSFVYRCPVCNSYDAPCIPEFNRFNLQPEEMAA